MFQDHFLPEMFYITKNGQKRLNRKKAIPTIFPSSGPPSKVKKRNSEEPSIPDPCLIPVETETMLPRVNAEHNYVSKGNETN